MSATHPDLSERRYRCRYLAFALSDIDQGELGCALLSALGVTSRPRQRSEEETP